MEENAPKLEVDGLGLASLHSNYKNRWGDEALQMVTHVSFIRE